MLKKYSELTAEQQKLVHLMYSTKETLEQFLYNFDDKGKYIGRQFTALTDTSPVVKMAPLPKAEPLKAARSKRKK